MPEAKRYTADLRKTVRLPRPDGALVRADDEIELHRSETSFLGTNQRMLEHQAGYTLALGLRRCHVPAICNVIPASRLVRTQIVRSKNIDVVLCDESLVVSPTPVGDSVGFVDISSDGVGFARSENWS